MQKLIEWNDQLMGAPMGVLVALACVVIGYMAKIAKPFPNKYIPVLVIVAGAMLFMFAAPENKEVAIRIWLVRNFCIGLGIGFIAWLGHKLVLKRIEEKLGWFESTENKNEETK